MDLINKDIDIDLAIERFIKPLLQFDAFKAIHPDGAGGYTTIDQWSTATINGDYTVELGVPYTDSCIQNTDSCIQKQEFLELIRGGI